MEADLNRVELEEHVRAALANLYNPSVLRNSPLVALFGLEGRADAASALRRALIDAIESLRPGQDTSPGSRPWRAYQILRRRYTEQVAQLVVATDLGLSVRQLQREEKLARELLADHLCAVYDLPIAPDRPIGPDAEGPGPDEETEERIESSEGLARQEGMPATASDERVPTRAKELEWLKSSAQPQMVAVEELVREVVDTVRPLAESLGVVVEYAPEEPSPRMAMRADILRQALLNLVTTAVATVTGERVCISGEAPFGGQARIAIHCGGASAPRFLSVESTDMARQLVELCGGCLELAKVEEGPLRATNGEMRSTQCEPCSTETFVARLSIPAAEEVPVLFVDDNADALQLFERYLMGTRYRFVGAQDAGQAMAAAAAFKPCAILLDVMMPKQDGWALLHYLREHPDTSNLPVIVATILPQEQLALTLGAAGFLRKPISRMDLLTALEPLWNLRQSARAPC